MKLAFSILIALWSLTGFGQFDWVYFTQNREVTIPTDSLLAYYTFNGNANDQSGNGYNGTVTGAVADTDRNGNSNSSYYFSGDGDNILLDAGLQLNTSQWSIAFWFRSQGVTTAAHYMAGWLSTPSGILIPGGTTTTLKNDIQLFDFGNTPNTLIEATPYDTGTYYFVVITYNSGFKAYIDNTLKISNGNTYSVRSNQFKIGTRGDGSFPFKGWIDVIYFYNKELTVDEINQLYNFQDD